MNADVARVVDLLRNNGILTDAALGQVVAAAGGESASVHDVIAALTRMRAPWDATSPAGMMEPHIHACLIAAAQGSELPYPGLRVGRSLVLRPLDFTGRKPRFLCVEFDARVALSTPPTYTYLKLAFEDDKAKLARESQLLSALQQAGCHDVTTIRDVAAAGGVAYQSSQLFPGRDISVLVGGEGALPTKTVVNVALRLLAALANVNAAGFYHRNLHPSHFVVSGEVGGACTLGLVGWTLGRAANESETDDPFFQPSNTPPQLRYPESLAYWPPEQRMPRPGYPLAEACDVYGFGAVLFYMLTGRPPAELGSVGVASANLPVALGALLEKLMAANPLERPSLVQAAETLVAIDQEISTPPAPVVAASSAATAELPPRRSESKTPQSKATQSKTPQPTKPTPAAKSPAAATPKLRLPDPSRQRPPVSRPPVTPSAGSNTAGRPTAATFGGASKKSQTKPLKPVSPPKRGFNPDDTVAIRRPDDDTKIELLKGDTKQDRGGKLREIDSTRTEPRVMVDDPLNLNLAATASLAKLSSDILRVHWPESSADQSAFVQQVNGCIERLTDQALIDQAERQAGFGKDKVSVGNYGEAVPLLLSAWQCLPSSREHYERLLKGRDHLALNKKSVFKKAFGAAVKFNPARIRSVYQLIQAGKLVPALVEADKLQVSAPNDGRAYWAMGIAADLLESWPLCELMLERLWQMPACGGADPVAVAAARVKLLMVRGDVEDTPAMLRDLEEASQENGVSAKFFDKFTHTITTDAHSRRYRRR